MLQNFLNEVSNKTDFILHAPQRSRVKNTKTLF